MRYETMERYRPTKEPFGTWLLAQIGRQDDIGALARCARADNGFPWKGDPQAVSKRLNQLGADPEMHLALEEAEVDWAAY